MRFVCHFPCQPQASQNMAVFTPSELQFLGRNYRQRVLQAQLRDKDMEVQYLRSQLENAMIATRIKEDSLRANAQLIDELKKREENAKIGRSKAQLALSEKAQALVSCQSQTRTLLEEVTMCDQALRQR